MVLRDLHAVDHTIDLFTVDQHSVCFPAVDRARVDLCILYFLNLWAVGQVIYLPTVCLIELYARNRFGTMKFDFGGNI